MDAVGEPRFRNWAGRIILGTQEHILGQIGVPSEIVRHVREDFTAGGEAAVGRRVPVDAVTKELMVGTPAQLLEQAIVLRDHRVDMMSVIMLGGFEEVRQDLTRFAEIMQRVSGKGGSLT